MSDTLSRPIEDIESDFAILLASGLPGRIAREQFERLWDEVNAVAARLVPTSQAEPYLALLSRMHTSFEHRYPESRQQNGRALRQR